MTRLEVVSLLSLSFHCTSCLGDLNYKKTGKSSMLEFAMCMLSVILKCEWKVKTASYFFCIRANSTNSAKHQSSLDCPLLWLKCRNLIFLGYTLVILEAYFLLPGSGNLLSCHSQFSSDLGKQRMKQKYPPAPMFCTCILLQKQCN